ncbi:glycosyltransferase family 87 protein [Candidatus Leptofilum sp.]|uniref:glycosyltransferase family 87 protein n=1 Tax=Candidatus Leptofilum sp. TaxID=3241576 RepID=UPI003B5B3FA2
MEPLLTPIRQRSHLLDFAGQLIFLFCLVGFAIIAYLAGGVDFRGYYGAATLILQGGNPYDYAQLASVLEEVTGYAGNNPFFYPPWFALPFLPLAYLPFQAARAIWLIINVVLFIAGLELCRKALNWHISGWRRWGLYWLTTVVFVVYCLRSEQVGILLFFGLVLALVNYRQNRPVLVGFGLLLALSKPNITILLVVVLVIVLWRWQRKSLVATVAWGAGALLVATVIMGAWWNFDRTDFGSGLQVELDGTAGVSAVRVNTTLPDFLQFGWGVENGNIVTSIIIFAGIGVAAILLWLLKRQEGSLTLPVLSSALLIFSLAFTPYALQYDYVPLILPVFWVIQKMPAMPSRWQWAVGGLLTAGFSVVLWQTDAYEGYWLLLGVSGAFMLTLAQQNSRITTRFGWK